MTSRKLAKQLGTLKAIKPRTEWRDRARDILLSQVRSQGRGAQNVSVFGGVSAYTRDSLTVAYRMTIGQLFARPLVLSGFLSVLLVGAISAGVASEKSIPGDPLYTVKQTHEQISGVFVSPENRPAFQLELAQKRLEEMNTLSDRPVSAEEKNQKAVLLAKNARESIATAQNDLEQLKKAEPKKAVQAAAVVNQRAGEYERAITQNGSHVQEVIANLDETQSKALAVIVDKKDTAGVGESQVASHISDAIDGLQERLARLETVSAAGFKSAPRLTEKSSEAKKNLQDARDGVERRDFKLALDKISLSRGIITAVEKELGAQEENTAKKGDSDNTGNGDLK
ncbi:hypothetical protein HY732_03935 [Candidatus Uhrbacteria bacterium]|nr:hypothetical protein [Candidatus Uhrbacteria bacterium]